MTERVRPEDTHHRKGKDAWPDPYSTMRVHFPIVERLRDTPRSTWRRPDELPTSVTYLAEAFHDAGWDDLARRAYYEVIELHREAGESAGLRRALTALRTLLVQHAQHEEALPLAEEELRLAEELTTPGDEVAGSARYWVLHLLGELGRHEESARVAGEAVAALRENPGHDLAHARLEHARRLAKIGELDRAVEEAGEAAEFWRHAKDPLRTYAVLDQLSTLQLRLGRFEDSRASHAEAVAVIRKRARDDRFRTHLAGALNNHGNRLHDLGLDEEAVVAAKESVKRYRVLLAKTGDSEQLELRLALALVSLGARLHDVDRLDESLAANDEAIALASARDSEAARDELARAWTNRAGLLVSRRAYREAADAAAKGIELYRTSNGKAMARNTFAVASAHVGDHDVALEASLRSIAEYRAWHAEEHDEYAHLLADALTDHAIIRELRAERAEARAAITESLALHEELAATNPGRFRRELDRAREVAARI
ncbi:hypothetical protein [Lentzea sp.]|uniref:hypothetical protein n=1 Tax=Lentzea sp. TaxID=56099 RepID=UPI002ED50D6C